MGLGLYEQTFNRVKKQMLMSSYSNEKAKHRAVEAFFIYAPLIEFRNHVFLVRIAVEHIPSLIFKSNLWSAIVYRLNSLGELLTNEN